MTQRYIMSLDQPHNQLIRNVILTMVRDMILFTMSWSLFLRAVIAFALEQLACDITNSTSFDSTFYTQKEKENSIHNISQFFIKHA